MKKPATILVVDDDTECISAIRQLLHEASGMRVLTAESGGEALRILEKEPVDCLVTDYRMPGMNGLDLLAKAKERQPAMGRILMTAFPDFDIAMRAVNDVGVQGFFRKPVEPDALCRAVEQAVEA